MVAVVVAGSSGGRWKKVNEDSQWYYSVPKCWNVVVMVAGIV